MRKLARMQPPSETINADLKSGDEGSEALSLAALRFPTKVPAHYAELMRKHPVLRRVVLPSAEELVTHADDALTDVHADESRYQPVSGIIHRYPGKLLFLPTQRCLGHCRFCFRSGLRIPSLTREELDAAIGYIRKRQDVREVIVTGGDPLALPATELDEILTRIRAIPHVEIIRVGTRALAYDPSVVTPELVRRLAMHKPLLMMLTFVHAAEITSECEEKLALLADSGIVLLQQGPLLRGINDDARTLIHLYERLARNRVIAYYAIYGIHAPGVRHFVVNREEAQRLLGQMENQTSGYCIPHMSTLDQANDKMRSMR